MKKLLTLLLIALLLFSCSGCALLYRAKTGEHEVHRDDVTEDIGGIKDENVDSQPSEEENDTPSNGDATDDNTDGEDGATTDEPVTDEPVEENPEDDKNEEDENEDKPEKPSQDNVNNPSNSFYNDSNNYISPNEITIRPAHVYWENDTLVAKCFVINGLTVAVTDLNVQSLEIANDTKLLASGAFGVLNGVTLSPNTHVVWTFTFSADCVENYGGDLTKNLNCHSRIAYSY